MGYMHIENLYKPEAQDVLMFKEVYAMEKIHGTSAHIGFRAGQVTYFSGGEKYDNFVALFDRKEMEGRFTALGHDQVTVYGEAYGGKQQRQSHRYGQRLKFVAFDVRVGGDEDGHWLSIPAAEEVCKALGLEFVHYAKVVATLEALDAERDAPSVQAVRNGISEPQPREGIVIRPLFEVRKNSGSRVMAKHKRVEERETASVRVVGDEKKSRDLATAEAIVAEYATPTRLDHVLDHLRATLQREPQIEDMRAIIEAMVEDITREGAEDMPKDPDSNEMLVTGALKGAIGGKTARMFKVRLGERLHAAQVQ